MTGTTYKYGFNPGEGVNRPNKRKKLTMQLAQVDESPSLIEPNVPSFTDVQQRMKDIDAQAKRKKKEKSKRPLPKARSEYAPGKETYLA